MAALIEFDALKLGDDLGDDKFFDSLRSRLEQNFNTNLPLLIQINKTKRYERERRIQEEKRMKEEEIRMKEEEIRKQNENIKTAGKTGGGAIAGAGIGAMIGGPPGAALGFFLGGLFGYNV